MDQITCSVHGGGVLADVHLVTVVLSDDLVLDEP